MSKFNKGGLPWAIGADVRDCLTAEDVINKADLNWTVEKCPLVAKMPLRIGTEISKNEFAYKGSVFHECKSAYATYRTDINRPLGIVQDRYEVIQNNDAFKFFNTVIGEGNGNARWDKAGCLNQGETVFVTAKLPVKTEVNGDPIDNYLIFSNGHAGNRSVDIMISPVRVACTNMLNGAINKSYAHIRIRHTQSAKEKLEIGSQVLKVACKQAIDVQGIYNTLYNKKMNDKEVMEYLCRQQLTQEEIEFLLSFDKEHGFERVINRQVRALESANISTRKANVLYNMFDYYCDGIAQQDIYGTVWGAYNAVTGFYCNVANLEGEKRMNSLVWGNANNNMNKAFSEAVAYAS